MLIFLAAWTGIPTTHWGLTCATWLGSALAWWIDRSLMQHGFAGLCASDVFHRQVVYVRMDRKLIIRLSRFNHGELFWVQGGPRTPSSRNDEATLMRWHSRQLMRWLLWCLALSCQSQFACFACLHRRGLSWFRWVVLWAGKWVTLSDQASIRGIELMILSFTIFKSHTHDCLGWLSLTLA